MANVRALQGLQGTVGQPTAQVINGSLKFKSASSQYLSSTSTFQNTKSYEMTFSFWLKRSAPTGTKETQYVFSSNVDGTIFFSNSNSDQLGFNLRGSSGSNFFTYTSAKLRDYNAWYHVVVALNLGSGTQSQRFKCYINNVEQTMSNTSYPSNAYHTGGTWYIGAYKGGPSHFPDYYLSNFYCISGQTLDPSYFGFTDPQTNTWRPKKYTGTFTFDNSFYLPLDNEDDFGKDKSGEENHFTQNNFSGTSIDPDVVKDSPSGAVFGGRSQTGITTTSSAPANYCTLNPSDNIGATLSNGNLTITDTSVYYRTVFGTQTSFNGKHYFEVDVTTLGTTMGVGIFVGNGKNAIDANNYPYDANTYIVMYNGSIYHDGSTYSYQSSYGAGDTVGVAIDSKNKKVWLSKNGTYVSGENPTTGSGGMQSVNGVGAIPDGDIYPVVMVRNATVTANFGQKPFKYAPPQGYLPLNSASVRPNKVVPRPDQYVGATTYNGNGTQRSFDIGMKPDLVWIKARNVDNYNHQFFDSVRGAGKRLQTNNTNAEDTDANTLAAFNIDGFRVGTNNGVNQSGKTYVAWTWKAGGSKNTFNVDDVGYASAAAAGLTGGDITPTGASVGTKQGFSIIEFTGSGSGTPSIPHGLSEAPTFIIQKDTGATTSWRVFAYIGTTWKIFNLNNTDAASNATETAPTSSLFYANGNGNAANTQIAYLWHDVPGLQKFGKYIGNGSADGPFVELGFRPAVLFWKKSSASGGNWNIEDNGRSPSNPVTVTLRANTAEQDLTTGQGQIVDLLSNGFKVKNTSDQHNSDGVTYIYMAWAEHPASNLFGGQSNAR